MLRIDRILETALYVEEMGRAIEFYQRIFGFPVLARSAEPDRLTSRRRWLNRGSPAGIGHTKVLFPLVACVVVLLEQVLAEVAREVAPHGVDVVGVVLRVVQFDEE